MAQEEIVSLKAQFSEQGVFTQEVLAEKDTYVNELEKTIEQVAMEPLCTLPRRFVSCSLTA